MLTCNFKYNATHFVAKKQLIACNLLFLQQFISAGILNQLSEHAVNAIKQKETWDNSAVAIKATKPTFLSFNRERWVLKQTENENNE